MVLQFHREVFSDIDAVMAYYEKESGPQLADAFYSELRAKFQFVANEPLRFRIIEKDLRRANLRRFPYHFLFRQIPDGIRILVVRHHRRDPAIGTERE